MENKKIIWIYRIKNRNDYNEVINHLKELGARYSIAK